MSQADLIRVRIDGNNRVVSLSADHLNQMAAARQLGIDLHDLFEERCDAARWSLDFREVDHITSVGLNELIGINSQARSRGVQLVLLDVCDSVRDVFALTRLERLFEFESSPISV